jgi:hypothetical protein
MIPRIKFYQLDKINELISKRDPKLFIIDEIPKEFIDCFSDENLSKHIGHATCLVKDIPNKKQIQMLFSDYFQKMQEQLQQNNINKQYTLQIGTILSKGRFAREKFPPFANLSYSLDKNPLFHLFQKRIAEVNLWMDSGDNKTGLHFDPSDNIFMLLEGIKDWYLVEKKNTNYMYLDQKSAIYGHASLVNPDLLKYPLVQKAEITKITIHAGQALFIPAGYWHEVLSFQKNKAVNMWMTIPFLRKLTAPLRHYYMKRLRSLLTLGGPIVPHTVAKKEIKDYDRRK